MLVTALVVGACGTNGARQVQVSADRGAADDTVPSLPPAPWSGDTLAAAAVPREFIAAWQTADNRSACALLAPETTEVANATPRIAQFSGGWGVAFDTPSLRSAFGVAGTGTEPGPDTYDDWPNNRLWSDGSRAGWGPEGGSGPNQLAYLVIPGQACLYNVWSRLGADHLLILLEQLRFVQG